MWKRKHLSLALFLAATLSTPLPASADDSALIVDADGLAIDATDRTLTAGIDSTNAAAGAPVLYFRTDAGLALDSLKATASNDAATNAIGERILAGVIGHSGWLVVLRLPSAA